MSSRKRKNTPTTTHGKKSPSTVTWAHATRDIVIRLIDKGAIIPGTVAAITLLLLWKLPEDAAKELVFKVYNNFVDLSIVGWILAAVVAIAWQAQTKSMRTEFSREAARIGKEKSDLQRQLAVIQLGSSDSREPLAS